VTHAPSGRPEENQPAAARIAGPLCASSHGHQSGDEPMYTNGDLAARWTGGLKAAAGFVLAVALLLLVNLTVYHKMRQLTESWHEQPQAEELLRVLVVTDLFAVVFLSSLVLLLNRQLTLRDAAARAAKQAGEQQEALLRDRLAELTRANQALQAESTERRRAAAQLRQFQKMEALGRLVGVVGHEFNNYLTVIMGFGEQLAQQLPPGTQEQALAAEIFTAGERSAELTRALLGLVRTGDPGRKALDVNRQVEQMRRMLVLLLGKRVRLEVKLAADLPPVQAAPGQIEQVLLNLAANARDALPQGGRVTVETRAADFAEPREGVPAGRYVVLSVADNGAGLSDEARLHLFEPFYTTKETGTGLGLATVRDLVEAAGGRVVADSTPGQGATFKAYWPALGGHPERGPHAAEPVIGRQPAVSSKQ
jgi:signal transduction histidine kinase